ncbi:MAG: dihydrofolate reductase family protein [Betaproteobacteria bacterium]
MKKVTFDISMSLDGYITGPNSSIERPLGEGGELLHQWLYRLASWRKRHGINGGKINKDASVLDESFKRTGAVIMGRRMFDYGVKYWGDNPPFHVPVFVLTHEPREKLVKEGATTFTFVTDGIKSALNKAKASAGNKNVAVAGGAETAQQFIKARLLDEIQIHLVPILLGGGIRLFDHIGSELVTLKRTKVIESRRVTHIRFRVAK